MDIKVTIKGVTPLLMNRWAADGDGGDVTTGSGIRPNNPGAGYGSPREQAEKAAYRDTKTGELFIPGTNILACIIEAGRFHKSGKRQMTTGETSIVTAGLMVQDIVCSLGTKDFEVDVRGARVPPKIGPRINRCRPILHEWTLTFTLEVDESEFKENVVRDLVDTAGKKVGLCDYRPQKKGPFGKFVVVKWVVSKNGKP